MIVVNGPEMGLEQPVRAPAAHWAAVRRHEGCARNVVADSTPHRGSPISRIWSKPVEPLPELGSETCSDEAQREDHLTTRLRPEAALAARTAAAKGALERRNHAIAFKNI